MQKNNPMRFRSSFPFVFFLVFVFVVIVVLSYQGCRSGKEITQTNTNTVVANGCDDFGNLDPDSEKGRSNQLKNRAIIEKKQVRKINVTEFLKSGEDSAWFNKEDLDDYVSVEAILISGEDQGPESCNCDLASEKNHDGDIHFYLSDRPDAKKYESFIAEITPKYRAKYGAIKENAYNTKRVKIYGYLFYDKEHRKNSINTCKTCDKANPNPRSIWRNTCWEIHPVVKIEVLD